MGLAQLPLVPITVWPADESFRYIRDFLACRNGIADFTPAGPNPGPGYEIVDAYYQANQAPLLEGDWVVLRSNGEAGTYPHYIHMQFGNNGHVVRPYLHWDADNHKGWPDTSVASPNITHGNFQGDMAIHADLDEVHIVISNTSSYRYWNGFGRLKPDNMLYDGTAVRLADALAFPGGQQEGAALTLPSWPNWARIGVKVYHWDTKRARTMTITDVDPAARVIVVDLALDMEAGSWLAGDLCLFRNVGSPSPEAMSKSRLVCTPSRTSEMGVYGYLCTSQIGTFTDGLYGYDANRKRGVTQCVNAFWLRHENSGEGAGIRGHFGLIGDTATPALHGEAMVDKDGQAWRVYKVRGSSVAMREKT